MASAQVAGAMTPPVATTGQRRAWDRDSVINAIQEWVATYGEPPRAADWNPSSAKWSGQLWRVERYRAGRSDGSPWPALNSAKRPFGGSLTAAIVAAGFEPAKPGPRRPNGVEPPQAQRSNGAAPQQDALEAALVRARSEAAAARRTAKRLAAELERAPMRGAGDGAALAPVRAPAGAAGPGVLADALKSLAQARAAGGNPTRVRAALRQVAEAAAAWEARL